jgi:hypothetical protein
VRNTNFAFGTSSLILRAASSPFRSGIAKSAIITSGLSLTASLSQGPTVPYRSNDGKCFFQQVDTQSISEDRVVIGDEDARAERISVDSLHWDNPLDPPELRFGRRRKASEGKNPLGTPSLANRRRKLVKWPVSVS